MTVPASHSRVPTGAGSRKQGRTDPAERRTLGTGVDRCRIVGAVGKACRSCRPARPPPVPAASNPGWMPSHPQALHPAAPAAPPWVGSRPPASPAPTRPRPPPWPTLDAKPSPSPAPTCPSCATRLSSSCFCACFSPRAQVSCSTSASSRRFSACSPAASCSEHPLTAASCSVEAPLRATRAASCSIEAPLTTASCRFRRSSCTQGRRGAGVDVGGRPGSTRFQPQPGAWGGELGPQASPSRGCTQGCGQQGASRYAVSSLRGIGPGGTPQLPCTP